MRNTTLSDSEIDRDSPIFREVEGILGKTGLERTFSPIEEPSGLPRAAFVSEDWLQLEYRRIFKRSWVFAAADGEIPEPGAIKPLEICGVAIFIVRGADDVVRAFHNVCPHRGTLLIDAPCKKKRITCPYHAWSFALDGKLKSRPYFHGAEKVERFDDENPSGIGLIPIRCENWNGCYFVNISGEAEPFEDFIAPMVRRTPSYDFSHIRWIAKTEYRIKSNWKLILENYMEGYHVFNAHPRLIAHAPMNVRWSGEWIDHVFYNDYVAPHVTEGRGDGLPHFPNLSEEDTRRGMWMVGFPNFAVEVYADQFVVVASYPISPGETLEELHFFVAGDAAATDPKYQAGRDELVAMWHDLNEEDVDILERLQIGRRSPAFEGSLMSPAWEVPAHQLARKVIGTILSDEE